MNYFQLFDLPQQYSIDLEQLTARYHALQKALHPDRHVKAATSEREEAVRYAACINEGYRTLKQPLSRAIHLLACHNVMVDLEQQTVTDEDFLMGQIALRQQLAQEGVELSAVRQQVGTAIAEIEATLTQHLAEQAWLAAKSEVIKLQFYDKIMRQLKEKIG